MTEAEKKLRKKLMKVIKDNEVVGMAYSSFDAESVDFGVDELLDELMKLIAKLK